MEKYNRIHISPIPFGTKESQVREWCGEDSESEIEEILVKDYSAFVTIKTKEAASKIKSGLTRKDLGAGIVTVTIIRSQDMSDAVYKRRHEDDGKLDERKEKMVTAATTLIECLGEDVERQGLLKTPSRMVEALLFFTNGYTQTPHEIMNDAIFFEDHDDMVLIKNIELFSMCEHHMVPFIGKAHVAYIPDKKVLGLSKVARIAEIYSRRLQVQERLTKQIATAIMDTIEPSGVAVVVESAHLCMVMRGVQKPHAKTTTSVMLGVFREDPKTREEFLSLIRDN